MLEAYGKGYLMTAKVKAIIDPQAQGLRPESYYTVLKVEEVSVILNGDEKRVTLVQLRDPSGLS